ncbi:MAG: GNAT family N-acetyltransferase [Candidatus Izemoplasmatales bacterium]|nr:GNAT family N-acetyltransferase [Candidatus Izemoplasmatales bacterium]
MIFNCFSPKWKSILEKYLDQNLLYDDYYGSELNFQNLIIWSDVDNIEIGEENNQYLLIRSVTNGYPFYFPPVATDWQTFIMAIKWIEADCVDGNIPFLVRGLSEQMIAVLASTDAKYRVYENRDMYEYLYSSSSLRTLVGKTYHNKRNLVHQFMKLPGYIFRPYVATDETMVIDLLHKWEEHKRHAFEHETILKTLNSLDTYGCFADVIVLDDKIIAFAIGANTKKMGLVFFEKADTDYPGIYAAINYLFANRHFANVSIINRQEDLGIAELRKAKLSYNPSGFAKKYSLSRNHLAMDEVMELKALYHEAFTDSDGFLEYFFTQKFRADNVIFHKQDHHIISALHLIKKTLSIKSTLFPCPFVVGAATLKAHRGQGLMNDLLKQALHDLYNRNISICALSPFAESFYLPSGFVTVNRLSRFQHNIISTRCFTYQDVDTETLAAVAAIYQSKLSDFTIFVDRSLEYWQSYYEAVKADSGKITLVKENGTNIGYYTQFDTDVEEICFLDDTMITTVDRLSGLTINQVNSQGQTSHIMIRIVNLKKMLLGYPYNRDLNTVQRIKFSDSHLPLNNVTLEITIKNGEAFIRNIEDYDEEITIEMLTEQIFITGSSLFSRPHVLIFDKY